jgi:DNA modification methylase
MKIETLQIKDLTPDPQNARQHDEKNLKAIQGSLKEFGQRKPIVITEDGVIVAGNGTVEAAKRLGWTKIECVQVPGDWTAEQTKAFALADNRTAELAAWSPEVLAAQLVELEASGFQIEEFGFEKIEVAEEPRDIVEDEIPESAPQRSSLGDIWQLGRHRLIVGDSTNLDLVETLMEGNTADLVFTDPPYGVEYQSNQRTKSDKFEVLKNDDVFLDIEPVIRKFNKGFIFVWTSWKVVTTWIEKLKGFGYPTNIIVWDKGGGGIGDLEKTFASDYELALVWHNGNKLPAKRIGSVWDIAKDGSSSYKHPTQKPVQLAVHAITHTTRPKQSVLDLFLGSGSTLIACEQTDRTCYGMELDPKYCDVIIARWESLTGQTAKLLSKTP